MGNFILDNVVIKSKEEILFQGIDKEAKDFLEKNSNINGELLINDKHIISGDSLDMQEALQVEKNKLNLIDLYSDQAILESKIENNKSIIKTFKITDASLIGISLIFIICMFIFPQAVLGFIPSLILTSIPAVFLTFGLNKFIKKNKSYIKKINYETKLIEKIETITTTKWNELVKKHNSTLNDEYVYSAKPLYFPNKNKKLIKL